MSTETKPKFKKLEHGGETAPPLGSEASQSVSPEQSEGQNQIAGMLEQYAQTKDAEIAIQIADLLLVEMGIAPSGDSSIKERPVSPPELGGSSGAIPVFHKGGKISALDQFFANKSKKK